MKRIIALLLLITILLTLSACSETSGNAQFFYPKKQFSHSSVMGSEQRDMADHFADTSYLINIYLLGPVAEDLTFLFPSDTRLVSVERDIDTITVTLSDNGTPMQDIEFSLASACLAKSVFENAAVNRMTLIRGFQSITLEPNTLLLDDSSGER